MDKITLYIFYLIIFHLVLREVKSVSLSLIFMSKPTRSIFQLRRFNNILVCRYRVCVDGVNGSGKLTSFAHLEVSIYTMSKMSNNSSNETPPRISSPRKRKYVTHECPPPASQRADLERQVSDLQRQCPEHEIITDIGSGLSTIDDSHSKPFWNEFTKELSPRLWLLPTEIDCFVMDLSSSSSSSRRWTQNSWFSVKETTSTTTSGNLPTIFSQSVTTLLQERMDNERQKIEENEEKKKKRWQRLRRSRGKWRVTRNELASRERSNSSRQIDRQRTILKKWFGTTRRTYNECFAAIEHEGVPQTKKALRNRFINSDSVFVTNLFMAAGNAIWYPWRGNERSLEGI